MLKEGKLAYIKGATLPSASDATAQGNQFTESIGTTSDDKGTEKKSNKQRKEAKIELAVKNMSEQLRTKVNVLREGDEKGMSIENMMPCIFGIWQAYVLLLWNPAHYLPLRKQSQKTLVFS